MKSVERRSCLWRLYAVVVSRESAALWFGPGVQVSQFETIDPRVPGIGKTNEPLEYPGERREEERSDGRR